MLLLIKGVLGPERLGKVREALAGAEFADGRETAGADARSVKRNVQVKAQSELGRAAGEVVVSALREDPQFMLAALPQALLPPLFSRYDAGMAYGEHLDNPLMGPGGRVRTDVSVTVFLSDPGEYDGGELVINSDYGEQAFKGDPGDVLVYPSTTLHRVESVTRGARLVAVTWAQSLVRDPARRRILYDLAVVSSQLSQTQPGRPEAAVVQKCHFNLVRMWADT